MHRGGKGSKDVGFHTGRWLRAKRTTVKNDPKENRNEKTRGKELKGPSRERSRERVKGIYLRARASMF